MTELPKDCGWGAITKNGAECHQVTTGIAARLETVDGNPPRTGVVVYGLCPEHRTRAVAAGEWDVGGTEFLDYLNETYPGRVWIAQRTAT